MAKGSCCLNELFSFMHLFKFRFKFIFKKDFLTLNKSQI